jgi:pentatricopeptide repeat protein
MCRKRRWKSAEKLLDSVMEMEVYFDSFACGLLMERYCRSGKLEKALVLHEKIKKMKGSLDVNAYNAVLDRLMMRQKEMVEEAVVVFEYMKEINSVNSKSFTIMIQGLCRVKEMKKAMRSHDEMLRLGLKPDLVTYKRLILGFK